MLPPCVVQPRLTRQHHPSDGNAEANAGDDGDGTMEAIYFGNDFGWNREWPKNLTSGPFIGADIENGMCQLKLPLFARLSRSMWRC